MYSYMISIIVVPVLSSISRSLSELFARTYGSWVSDWRRLEYFAA
jgi:hypothetical protein